MRPTQAVVLLLAPTVAALSPPHDAAVLSEGTHVAGVAHESGSVSSAQWGWWNPRPAPAPSPSPSPPPSPSPSNVVSTSDMQKANVFLELSTNVYRSLDSPTRISSLDGWEFQERVGEGAAHADIYYKGSANGTVTGGENGCLISIAGTDSSTDIWYILYLFGYAGTITHPTLGRARAHYGTNQYYRLIRNQALSACAGRTGDTIVTGHSLGGGAAIISQLYGDAVESWSFAPPKVFAPLSRWSFSRSCPFTLPRAHSFYTSWTVPGATYSDVISSLSTPILGGSHCQASHAQLLKSCSQRGNPASCTYSAGEMTGSEPNLPFGSSSYLASMGRMANLHGTGPYQERIRAILGLPNPGIAEDRMSIADAMDELMRNDTLSGN